MSVLRKPASFVLSRITIRGAVHALLLFTAYSLAAYCLLPDGVSRAFSAKSSQIGAILVTILVLASLVAGRVSEVLSMEKNRENLERSHFMLALLPLTPIVRYTILNQTLLTPSGSAVFLSYHLALSLIATVLVPHLLARFVSRAIAVVVGVSVLSVYFSMPVLSDRNRWLEEGALPIQLTVWAVSFLVLALFYPARRSFLSPLIVVFFALNTLDAAWSVRQRRLIGDRGEWALEKELASRSFSRTPDIYLLTYDSYVENEIMLHYGIDNSEQESYLIDHGFTIYRGSYSIGDASRVSMAALFGLSRRFPDLTKVISGDSVVVRSLNANGYSTFFVASPHFFGRHEPQYDVTTHRRIGDGSRVLIKAVALGRFRFDLEFEKTSLGDMVQEKTRIIRKESSSPKFLYNHTGPWHSQNSGQCLPDEVDRFRQRLKTANLEMIDDVEAIEESKRQAIVIIHGDHGPYLTGDCARLKDFQAEEITRLHLLDRFGAFLAIKWPDGADQEHYELQVIQDIFPAVFSYVYDDPTIMDHTLDPVTFQHALHGVQVKDGIIVGGSDDGKRLFEGSTVPPFKSPTDTPPHPALDARP